MISFFLLLGLFQNFTSFPPPTRIASFIKMLLLFISNINLPILRAMQILSRKDSVKEFQIFFKFSI